MRIRKEGLDLALQQASQAQALTGDEFMSLWRPGIRPPRRSAADAGAGGGQWPGAGGGQWPGAGGGQRPGAGGGQWPGGGAPP
jgi:hypothetical protein